MARAEFERLVCKALEQIPEEIARGLDNGDVVVEDLATREQVVGSGFEEGTLLLGLYEAIPLTDRYGYVRLEEMEL